MSAGDAERREDMIARVFHSDDSEPDLLAEAAGVTDMAGPEPWRISISRRMSMFAAHAHARNQLERQGMTQNMISAFSFQLGACWAEAERNGRYLPAIFDRAGTTCGIKVLVHD